MVSPATDMKANFLTKPLGITDFLRQTDSMGCFSVKQKTKKNIYFEWFHFSCEVTSCVIMYVYTFSVIMHVFTFSASVHSLPEKTSSTCFLVWKSLNSNIFNCKLNKLEGTCKGIWVSQALRVIVQLFHCLMNSNELNTLHCNGFEFHLHHK